MTVVRLHAIDEGPEGAPVLVLGPSLGTDTGLFDAQTDEFDRTHRVIRYDLRGHGSSEVVAGSCTVADLADDVLGLLDSLGVDRFSYAGVSIGGAVGLEIALRVPDRVEKLALLASAARFSGADSYAERAQQVRAEGTEFLLPSRTGLWFTAEWAGREPDEAERLRSMLRSIPAEGYAACCDAIATFDVRPRLGEVTAPTLVLSGSEDPATTPELMRELAEGIPDARFVVVPGAGHLPNATHPTEVNAALRAHLGD